MIFRDISFDPYGDIEQDGWQAIIKCKYGKVSVRYGGKHLFTTPDKPFECRYNGDVWPAQDENDVYHWVKTGEILSEKESTARIIESGKAEYLTELLGNIARKFNIPTQELGLSCEIRNDDLKRYLDEQDGIYSEE